MSVTVDWPAKVINVPQVYLQDKGGGIYEMDINQFRLALRDLEDDETGIAFLPTHDHNPEVVLSGTTYSRMVLIINGYTITFEDGQYAVNIKGANSNIADVLNLNQVSVRSFNAAGLITDVGGGFTLTQEAKNEIAHAIWIEDLSTQSPKYSASERLKTAADGSERTFKTQGEYEAWLAEQEE